MQERTCADYGEGTRRTGQERSAKQPCRDQDGAPAHNVDGGSAVPMLVITHEAVPAFLQNRAESGPGVISRGHFQYSEQVCSEFRIRYPGIPEPLSQIHPLIPDPCPTPITSIPATTSVVPSTPHRIPSVA